jgi:hypothetical protein
MLVEDATALTLSLASAGLRPVPIRAHVPRAGDEQLVDPVAREDEHAVADMALIDVRGHVHAVGCRCDEEALDDLVIAELCLRILEPDGEP